MRWPVRSFWGRAGLNGRDGPLPWAPIGPKWSRAPPQRHVVRLPRSLRPVPPRVNRTRPGDGGGSVGVRSVLERLVIDQGGDRAADIGIEAVASEQRVRALAALTGVSHAREAPDVTCEEALGCRLIRADSVLGILDARSGSFAALLEDEVHGRSVDALQAELLADRALAPRPRSVAGLDPRPGERLIVEEAELQEPCDRVFDERGRVARRRQAPADFGDRPRADLEEPGGSVEH